MTALVDSSVETKITYGFLGGGCPSFVFRAGGGPGIALVRLKSQSYRRYNDEVWKQKNVVNAVKLDEGKSRREVTKTYVFLGGGGPTFRAGVLIV